MATTVWCLIIDDNHKPVGSPFEIVVTSTLNVAGLRKKVKEEAQIALPANQLTVWQCKEPKLVFGEDDDELEEQIMRVNFADKNKAVKLGSQKRMSSLELSENETILLVQASVQVDSDVLMKDEASVGSVISPSSSNNSKVSASSANSDGSWIVIESTCPREATVAGIWKKLEAYNFLWACGTPGSGKTTLAGLLCNYVRRNHPSAKVKYIPLWKAKDKEDWLARLTKSGFVKNPPNKTLLVFDEGQTTYADKELWFGFLKSITRGSNFYIIIFASYGSILLADTIPSIEWPAQMRITLQPMLHDDNLPAVGLLFTKDEFNDTIQRRYQGLNQCCFDETFFNGLWKMTGGHIGAIYDCLHVIETHDSYRSRRSNPKLGLFSWNTLETEITFNYFMKQLAGYTSIFSRGLPKSKDVQQKDVNKALASVIQNQSIETNGHDSDTTTYSYCYQRGWLHSDNIGSIVEPLTAYVFPSLLHQWYLEWMLFFDTDLYPSVVPACSLVKFAIEVIALFNPKMLSSKQRIGPACVQRPPEAHYQDEFYRCSHVHSQGSLVSFPEFGTARGRVDFYVKSKKWGIELLRDGDRLAEHSGRFSTTGQYGTTILFDDYIILDCRTSQPQKQHPNLKNLYHVVFENDYTCVTILDNSCREVAAFALINNHVM